ncbi:hypothetical protein LX36DRAFT_662729 [Colletotrichum falcatum]|nr:hypothetical protein LX36DRAFT_662729 [Colletotrichum falcatum]
MSFLHALGAAAERPAILHYAVSLATVGLALLYGLYRWLLPKPIPGIANSPEATASLLGDAPAMIKEVAVTGEFRVWCAKQVARMNSPLCQIFIRPFSKPWVLVADFREAKDMLTRRRELDKSSFLSDGMGLHGLLPRHLHHRRQVQVEPPADPGPHDLELPGQPRRAGGPGQGPRARRAVAAEGQAGHLPDDLVSHLC